MSTLETYLGSNLTNGAHNAYHRALCDLIAATTAEALYLQELYPQYQEAVDLEQELIKIVSASANTINVTRANANADAWLQTLFGAQKAFMKAPEGSEVRATAEQLKPIIDAYDGLYKKEMNKQITETNGLLADLSEEGAAAAVAALGLAPVVEALGAENASMESYIRARTSEEAARTKKYGTLTATQQRKVVDEIYTQVVSRVNAANNIYATTTIEEFIHDAAATASYYANIASQGGSSGGDTALTPVPGDEEDSGDGSDDDETETM